MAAIQIILYFLGDVNFLFNTNSSSLLPIKFSCQTVFVAAFEAISMDSNSALATSTSSITPGLPLRNCGYSYSTLISFVLHIFELNLL
jgi:hypothetical protein